MEIKKDKYSYLGIGFLVLAIAAFSFWHFYLSKPSKPPELSKEEAIQMILAKIPSDQRDKVEIGEVLKVKTGKFGSPAQETWLVDINLQQSIEIEGKEINKVSILINPISKKMIPVLSSERQSLLCQQFPPVEGEIICQEAIEIALEEYSGEVFQVYRTTIFNNPENREPKNTWVIGIELNKPIVLEGLEKLLGQKQFSKGDITVDASTGEVHLGAIK